MAADPREGTGKKNAPGQKPGASQAGHAGEMGEVAGLGNKSRMAWCDALRCSGGHRRASGRHFYATHHLVNGRFRQIGDVAWRTALVILVEDTTTYAVKA